MTAYNRLFSRRANVVKDGEKAQIKFSDERLKELLGKEVFVAIYTTAKTEKKQDTKEEKA